MKRSRLLRRGSVGIALIALVLAPVPISSIDYRNSEDQLAKRGVEALRVERTRYFPPREWRSLGEMNPLNYWRWAPDPWFSANDMKTANDFAGEKSVLFKYQLIVVNSDAKKEELEERILAVQIGEEVFEYSLPDWTSGLINSDIVFVKNSPDEMIFLYTESRSLLSAGIFSYFLSIPFPLQSNVFEKIDADSSKAKQIIDRINNSSEPSLIYRFCEPTTSPLIRLYVRDYLSWSCN